MSYLRGLIRGLTLILVGLMVSVGLLPTAAPAHAAERPMLRWAYYVTYDPTSRESLQRNATTFDFVSPGIFSMTGNGGIVGEEDPSISHVVRDGRARLVPMLQNRARYSDFSPVLNDPGIRAEATDAVTRLVTQHGYDGIHIDFEGLNASDRPGLTAFMTELAARLRPTGKLVTIAIPSREREQTTGWAGAYDYAALGRVADLVVIMTYAYRTPSSTQPGSISPLPKVERAVAYTVSQIPAQKVLLGIGLWGYDWNLTRRDVVTRRHPETIDLASRFKGQLSYSDVDQSAVLRYQNGGHQHEVWFEDRRSVAAKSTLVSKYGLAGFAAWRLGHEDPSVWNLFAYSGPPDYAIAGGRFFTQTGGGGSFGYSVVDGPFGGQPKPVRFWSEFVRLGGVPTLGYPASRRYVGADGFVYQAFQRGVLQWRPELDMAYLANTFEQLTSAGQDDRLANIGIPRPTSDDGSNGDWNRAREIRFDWLTDEAIRQHFLANPNPNAIRTWSAEQSIQLYGLPASPPERSGPFIVQRFQRISLQLWIENVPGMPPVGSVVGILGGDLLKEAQVIPADAVEPEPAPPPI